MVQIPQNNVIHNINKTNVKNYMIIPIDTQKKALDNNENAQPSGYRENIPQHNKDHI